MVEKGKIEKGVVSMLKLNMGVKSGERLLITTDVSTSVEWIKKESRELAQMMERSLLAKMVYEIASEQFPGCNVEFYTYPSVGRNGIEPGKEAFINDGYTIVDDENGRIYRVLERYAPPNHNTIRLDRPWNPGMISPDRVWVVPPPVGGGRYPCIAIYQRVIRF